MGARDGSYVLLRLPPEVRELFAEWLRANYPGKLKHVRRCSVLTRYAGHCQRGP
jgi:hypothetical protein